jgi:putative redox protein
MATMESRLSWREGMAFDASTDGFALTLDAGAEAGGVGYGPRPKALVLTALCGCTGMDVVAILKKMRVPIETLVVTARGTLAPTHPKVFTHVELLYEFTGGDLPLDKLERAVALSLGKYCAVTAMLRPLATITHTIRVNGASRLTAEAATIRYTPEGGGPHG